MIESILSRNRGQVLTPELIAGIVLGCQYKPDNSVDVGQFPAVEYKGFFFQAERFCDVIDEMAPLHVLQWAEVDERLQHIPFRPNYQAYDDLHKSGRAMQFTIRKDGELVGYCMMMLSSSLHTQTNLATEDSFFMRKDHRGGFTMIRFVKYMVGCLNQLGFHEIRVTSKLSNKSHVLMERAGFKPCSMQLVMMESDHA